MTTSNPDRQTIGSWARSLGLGTQAYADEEQSVQKVVLGASDFHIHTVATACLRNAMQCCGMLCSSALLRPLIETAMQITSSRACSVAVLLYAWYHAIMVRFIVMYAKREARTKFDHGRSGTCHVCCHTSNITASFGWGPSVRLDIDQLRSSNRRIGLSFARNRHKDERVSPDH